MHNAKASIHGGFLGKVDENNAPNSLSPKGAIDFSDVKKPRFWGPGVYIKTNLKGTYCELLVNYVELWGKNHNYLEIVIDNKPVRIQTTEVLSKRK